jgi:diaminopimelate epimerase
MTIQFYKYQGTGNDFILLDNRDERFDSLSKETIAHLCDRRFGIGADGLMLLNNCPGFDYEMRYFNADGGESTMCGNGGRCLTRFAYDMGMVKTTYSFLAIDGEHESSVTNEGMVALKMKDVDQIREYRGNFVLDTGSPHYVEMTDDVMSLDVYRKGKEIRNNNDFKEKGINVNFVEQTDERDKLIVRTYERGVENETYSCGTGVTASALVCYHNDHGFNRVDVQTKGGELSVEFEKEGDHFHNIWLIGPAEKVFEGTTEI